MKMALGLIAALSPAPGTNDLRPLRTPVDLPSGWAWLGWGLAALAVAAVLGWWWRRRRRAVSPPPAKPPPPPHERARRRLEAALALLDEPEPFCVEVSSILRVYLEERFQFHAPERTTEEFLGELSVSPCLTESQKQSVAGFLARCDLVKFARAEPTQLELRDLHAAAERLVNETCPTYSLPDDFASPKETQNASIS